MEKVSRGFTLIELLLVVAIIVMVGGISVPVYQSFQVKNDLTEAAYQISQSFLRAQLLSQSSKEDSNWGVSVQSNSIVVFKGSSYASRDASFDETFPLSSTITAGGVTEVVFSKVFGLAQSTGTMNLNSSTGETKTLTINGKGLVEY